MFQYQKGAIKTRAQHGRLRCSSRRFNTKKVRLKLREGRPLRLRYDRFNTKKVRLKPILADSGPSPGASFNTKKVRLKPSDQTDERDVVVGFNTKKVRLKPGACSSCCSAWSRFNTKKVRLKLHGGLAGLQGSIPFQYQKGAIKTRKTMPIVTKTKKVSIPKRCD